MENTVSGGSGRIMMVKLAVKVIKAGLCGRIGRGGTRAKR
jgi:hypothetical protein